jgi:hypothetical protein
MRRSHIPPTYDYRRLHQRGGVLLDREGTAGQADVSWQQIVAAVASAAGGAAWIATVGSGVVAIRLREAGLPVEPVVALMSPEHRFAIGAGILTAPLLAGLVAFLADWAWAGDPQKTPHWQRQLLAAGTVIAGIVFASVVLDPPDETIVAEGIAVTLAVVLALHLLKREPELRQDRHRFSERLVILLSVVVAAGIGAVLAETMRSPLFHDVSITIQDDHEPVEGGYITSTDYAVVVATKCNILEAVPRTRIARIVVGPDRFEC